MYTARRTLACPPASHISWPPSFSQHTIIELSSPFGLGSDMLSVVFDYIGTKKVGDNPHLLTHGRPPVPSSVFIPYTLCFITYNKITLVHVKMFSISLIYHAKFFRH